MMATAAMLQAAKVVEDVKLAERLRDVGYWMVKLVLPYKTLEDPFKKCGNPRWCTQYNNSQTGENIGPTLSGTSTWLTITLFEMLGIEYDNESLVLDPILDEKETNVKYTLRFYTSEYTINITKPEGFTRLANSNYSLTVDGSAVEGNRVKLVNDGKLHQVTLSFN